jgi:hypothetical protein
MIHEIRETITNNNVALQSTNGLVFLQKKINLKPGYRHTIVAVDHFDDAGQYSTLAGAGQRRVYQAYLSVNQLGISGTPLIPANGNGGPMAGDDEVLFKGHRIADGTNQRYEVFPNQTLGSEPTFSFYTPHLYFTIIFESGDPDFEVAEVAQSIYVAVESQPAEPVEYAMGFLRERDQSAWRARVRNGTQLNGVEIINGFPLWRMGGMRPELMGDPAIDNYFFEALGYASAEDLRLLNDLRLAVRESRDMVPPLEAFGTRDIVSPTPDWYRFAVSDFPELTVGPIREEFPPRLKADSGVTRMV